MTIDTGNAQRVVKNSVWLLMAETVSKLMALGIQIVAARYLGEKEFGTFAFAFAATSILMILADFGINNLLTREIARQPGRMGNFLGNAFALKGGLSLLAVGALIGFPLVSAMDPTTRMVVWNIGLALLINGYADIYVAIFRAHEQMSVVSVLMMIQRGLFFVLGLVVLWLESHVVEFSIAFLVTAFVNLGLSRRQMHKKHSLQPWLLERKLIREIFWSAWPIGGVILFSYIYFRIDLVMVYYLRGESETGWYSAVFKLIEATILLIASIRGALFPLLSRTYSEDPGQFQRIWQEATRYLLLIGIPAFAGTAFLAPRLVAAFFGEAYEPSVLPLQFLAWSIPFLCLNDLSSFLLISADRTQKIFKVVGCGALINIFLNFLLIPRWGIMGAAVSTCFTELFVFGVYYKTISKIFEPLGILSLVWRPLAGSGVMVLLLEYFSFLPLVVLIFIGVAVYLTLLAAFQTFNQADIKTLRRLLGCG